MSVRNSKPETINWSKKKQKWSLRGQSKTMASFFKARFLCWSFQMSSLHPFAKVFMHQTQPKARLHAKWDPDLWICLLKNAPDDQTGHLPQPRDLKAKREKRMDSMIVWSWFERSNSWKLPLRQDSGDWDSHFVPAFQEIRFGVWLRRFIRWRQKEKNRNLDAENYSVSLVLEDLFARLEKFQNHRIKTSEKHKPVKQFCSEESAAESWKSQNCSVGTEKRNRRLSFSAVTAFQIVL